MTRTTIALLASLIILSNACVIAVVDSSREGRSLPLQSEYHKTLDLEVGGAIILENTHGDIEIFGWEEERVDVAAYRRRDLPHSGGISIMGKRFSPPDIRTQSIGETIKIRTEEEGEGKDGNTVHYVLKVPRSIRLDRVSNGRGDILISGVYGRAVVDAKEGRVAIENYSGSLDIRLESGSVETELLDPRPEDSIRIRVERGDIVIYLEPKIAARFFLEAPAGNISSEIDLNQPLPAQKVSSITGDGGISLELTTLQGDIKIRKVEGSS
ncbi:MAG: hypothetical protein WAU81_14330 [Candidatus Aminicenantales bacterium]